MKTLLTLLALFLCAGCGTRSASPNTPVAWEGMEQLDTDLAHAIASDAPDIAKAVAALPAPPKGVPNAALVQTLTDDLKSLGGDLEIATAEADRDELLQAMHSLLGKLMTEAGLEQHQCDHDHHADHDTKAPQETEQDPAQ